MTRKISLDDFVEALFNVIKAETGGSIDDVLKNFGTDVRGLVTKMFVPCAIPERKKRRAKELQDILRHKEGMPKDVNGILRTISQVRCCGSSDHRMSPAHPKDWEAIDNCMSNIYKLHRAHIMEYTRLLDGILHCLLEKEGLRLCDDLETEVANHARLFEMWESIFSAHFGLIEEGARKTISAETHLKEIAEKVAFEMVGAMAVLKEEIKEHERS